jgi:hypothetical protein
MRRFIAGAVLGVLFLAPPAPAQYGPGDPASLVASWYARYLNRQPDPYAAYWTGLVQQGQPPEQVLSQILGTQEYYDKGGGTPEGFLQTLYQDVVGRPPAAQEMGYWLPRLAYTPRSDVAYTVLTRFPQEGQTPPPGYYGPRDPGYTAAPTYEYRRPRYRRDYWRR